MLALHPELARHGRARHFDSLSERLRAQLPASSGLDAAARLGWQAQDLNPAGAVGDAAAATPETGERIIDHLAHRLAELIEDVHRLPVSLLHNPTEIRDAASRLTPAGRPPSGQRAASEQPARGACLSRLKSFNHRRKNPATAVASRKFPLSPDPVRD